MANTFKSTITANIGTSETASYTAPASTTTTIIGFTVSNTTINQVHVDVRFRKSGGTFAYMVKGAPIPVGGSLVVVGGDQKVVLETGDSIRVTSSAAASVDTIASVLEIS